MEVVGVNHWIALANKRMQELENALRRISAPSRSCTCDLRTKLVGDGCADCNPSLALESIRQLAQDALDGESND
jgi:hypothetical protein